MGIFLNVVGICAFVVMLFSAYMLFRNNRVFKFRMSILEKDSKRREDFCLVLDKHIEAGTKPDADEMYTRYFTDDLYDKIPEYDVMLNTWCVWPLSKFIKEKE